MIFSRKFPLGVFIGLVLVAVFATGSAFAQFLTQPQPGDIYKEFSRIMDPTTKQWRVTDPNALASGAQQDKPNSILYFTIGDTVGAVRAEAILNLWGGHQGTTGKKFRLNAKPWITIPELGAANGIPAGHQGQCYDYWVNHVIAVPLNNLKQGSNTIEGTNTGQTCYNFNWGLWGWYDATIRVYYNSSKPHATGAITSPATGSTIFENPTIAASATGGAGINKVEFFASHEGWDPDGDGIYGGYQYAYHRLRNETTVNPRFNVGGTFASPYEVVWNTSLVPDQAPGSIKLIARIRDNAGTYFVTNEVTGLTLQRDSISVKLYKPLNVPEKFAVRDGGTTKTCTFTIPAGDNLGRALSASLILRTWNGTDAPTVLPKYHYVRINSDSIPNNLYGIDNFPSIDIVSLRTGALVNGTNTFKVFANTTHHGINIEWPGPAIIVTYSSTPLVLPSITQQPVGATVDEGQTVTFTVAATGSNPLAYQWQKNNVNINGATSPTYTTPALPASESNSVYRCVVSNAAGSVNSDGATVIVNGTPVSIIRHPANQTVGTGKTATFSVEATGSAPYTYQWQKNGSNITGATNAWYTTPATVIGDNGATYRCVVNNAVGPQTSNPATLTVVAGTPPSMVISDDFNATQLNTGIWKFISPLNDAPLSFTGAGTSNARASVAIPAAIKHDIWTDGLNGPRFLQIANNTDFEVELKFESVLNAQYQMQGLFIEQDNRNFMRFDFVRRTNETRVYCVTVVNNVATQRWNNIITIGNPSYMKVKRTGNTWQQYYSTSGTAWTLVSSFTFTTSVGRMGPWFGNAGTTTIPAFTGVIDYFFNNASRITPEDGALVPPGITVQPVSQSTTLGTPVTFSITAFGSEPLNYQWQKDSVDIPGATSASYTTPPPVQEDNGSTFRCVVTNAIGTVTSNNATLTVGDHASGIDSDDFNQYGLNTGLWAIIDPVANGFKAMTETNTPNAAFTVTIPAGTPHDAWSGGNYTYRLLQPCNNTDFELDAKFLSTPATPFQMQGILIQQDIDNYLRFDFLRNISGLTVYSASIQNATASERINFPISTGGPLFLRVRRVGNQWTELFSYDGVNWSIAGTFSRTLNVNSVGPFFGTAGANPPEFTGKIDYFQLTEEPLFNEDGGTAVDNFSPIMANISVNPGASGFAVTWTTDEPTVGRVDYGLTNAYELGTAEHQDLRTSHMLQILNLQPQTTYNFRVRTEDASGNTSASGNFEVTTAIPSLPVFNIWYGKNQTFGLLGNPAPRINILGNVADSNGILSLLFSLNGQPQESLSRGPDTRRLQRRGDFNIDLLYSRLSPGPNTIILTAVDSQFTAAYDTVTVNYVAGNSWPKAYSVDWSTVAQPQDVVQILDGKWTVENNELKNLETGYDRLIAIGEQSWVDYEITVPITVDAIDSAGFVSPSNGAAIGFLFRWPGHSDANPASTAGMQPKSGFIPLGSFSVHNWEMDGTQTKRMQGDQLRLLAEDNSGGMLQLGVKYMYKMRVTTTPGIGGLYKMKIWLAGTPEPATWNLQGQEPMSAPQAGSLLLVAHQVYARIGNITIVPLDEGSTITSDDFNAPTLNPGLWSFQNPRSDATVQTTGAGTGDAKLQISIPGGIVHEAWTPRNTAARIMQPSNNSTSFELDAKFDSQFTQDVQVHGILVEQDTSNYIRFDYSRAGTSTRIFAGTIQNGVYTSKYNQTIATGLPPYMRVKRLGAVWQLYYSFDNINWILTANFSHSLTVTSVGPYAGNTGASAPAYTAIIDYFFNSARPIVPEDGGSGVLAPVVVTEPVSQTVASSDSARFTVGVSGTPPFTHRWQKNNVDIAGATGASYTLLSANVATDNGAKFRCIISNSAGADTSLPATLTVLYPPSTLISDDFHTGSLNTSVWRFVNPLNDASFSFTGVGTTNARLHISVPGGSVHDIWTSGPLAPRIMQDVNNTNFEMEAKFESGVVTNHQEQGFFIQQNGQNYLRFDFVTHPTSSTNITRVYAYSFTNLVQTQRIQVNGPARGVQPLWLRVNRSGDTWTMYYSTNGTSWTTAGTFVHAMVVDSVGVWAGNAGSPVVPSFTSIIDYVFNTAAPLSPEDGVPPGIASHPTSTTVAEGRRASFTVVGAGSPPFSYQWQKNGINITNATSTSYTTQPLSLTDSGATFRCLVSNAFGGVYSNDAILGVVPAQPLPWWNSKWAFRIPLEIRSNAFTRFSKPVEKTINFSQALAILHASSALDTNSIRVIEVDSTHAILDTLVDQQFDLETSFDATTNAIGTVIFMMDNVTNANSVRYYDVYFDTVGGGSFTPPPVTNYVTISDTAEYYYFPSYKIVTPGGTYFYHKPGGAFVSLIDQNGQDWISWDTTAGALGEWRGVPNNGDAFHPGFTTATSWIIKAGPLRTRFRSRTTNNLWETEWDIFPYYARNTMLRRGATWWWLYEGTPGGTYDHNTDYWVRPNGQRLTTNNIWQGDVGPQEWAYFGDPNMSRILYVAKHEDDNAPDIFRDQDQGMTVWGFGRKDPCCIRYLDVVPQTFTFGLAEDSAFVAARNSINSAYKDLQVTQQDPQIEGSTGGSTLSMIVSDNFNAPSLNYDLWTYYNPRGDAALSMNGSALVIEVPGGIGVADHDVWTAGNFAPRIMQPANDVNFEVEAKFNSFLGLGFQLQGIIVEQDPANYIRFDFVRNSSTVNLFSATFSGGVPTVKTNTPITSGNPLYLRVKRVGNTWTQSYSYDGVNWTVGVTFDHALDVTSIGPFFGNGSAPPPTLVGVIDYFYNTEVPISPTKAHATDKPKGDALPAVFSLSPNYPNPFNPQTTISYGLPEPANVTLKIYNMLGQEIATIVDQQQNAGYYKSVWAGTNDHGSIVGSGVYIYRMTATGASGNVFTNTRKMILTH